MFKVMGFILFWPYYLLEDRFLATFVNIFWLGAWICIILLNMR